MQNIGLVSKANKGTPLQMPSEIIRTFSCFEKSGSPCRNKKSKNPLGGFLPRCGVTEIRTRDTLLTYTRFPGVPLQPLEHHSIRQMRGKGNTFWRIIARKRVFFANFVAR